MNATNILLSALLLTGCSASSPRPGQEEAFQVVWEGLYHMERESRPQVQWVEGNVVAGGTHADGVTWAGWGIQVADHGGKAISLCAFSHELMHWKMWLETSDVDPLHFRGEWGIVDSGGAGGTLYELQTRGL